jgi:Phosphomevalonate kinase
MVKIAISGKAKSGKDTLSRIIIKKLNLQANEVKLLAFATAIKKIIQTMFPGCDPNCLYGASELRETIIPGFSVSYRDVLCDIGKLGRSYDPDIWVKNLFEEMKLCKSTDNFIVTDLRFKNEFEKLKSAGFLMVRIKRQDSRKSNDISETQQDEILDSEFDYVFDNSGSLHELEELVKNANFHN